MKEFADDVVNTMGSGLRNSSKLRHGSVSSFAQKSRGGLFSKAFVLMLYDSSSLVCVTYAD